MGTGAKVGIGLGVVALLAGGGWFAWKKWGGAEGAADDDDDDDDGGGTVNGDVTKITSDDLAELHPDCRKKVEAIVAGLKKRGFSPIVYETLRSPERAAYLKEKGYSKAGTASLHCKRAAADIVDGRKGPDGRAVYWGASVSGVPADQVETRKKMAAEFFAALGEEAEKAGMEWGGSWKSFPDPAHVEDDAAAAEFVA